jgi:hypothetical protein
MNMYPWRVAVEHHGSEASLRRFRHIWLSARAARLPAHMTLSAGARLRLYHTGDLAARRMGDAGRVLRVAVMLLATAVLAPLAEAARVIGNNNELPHLSVKAIETDERGFAPMAIASCASAWPFPGA